MNLFLRTELAEGYSNPSQKIRVITEDWVGRQVYCPNCGNLDIGKYKNNKPVADFFCASCREDYELKSKKELINAKITDGAYRAMIGRLQSANNPNFFLLHYNLFNFSVQNFFVVPKHFFVPDIIQKRKALSKTARRAGWIGCNILLQNIPLAGKVYFVKEGKIEPRESVISNWQKTLFLKEEKEIGAKSWLLDIMRCIEKCRKKRFSLDEVYAFENFLHKNHPENKHIKDKIRQQLQVLRDKGYLKFIERGLYQLI